MTRKQDLLEAAIYHGGLVGFITAREIYEDPTMQDSSFNGMLHCLKKCLNQSLVVRAGKGYYKSPYRYQVTQKGLDRLDYYRRERGWKT